MACGFLFAFKLFIQNRDPKIDWIEHMVQRLTRSDIIHVEIIPVLGGKYAQKEGRMLDEGSELLASSVAHTAYVGAGYRAHSSHFCLRDRSYVHVFVPMHEHDMRQGVNFLNSLQGKSYNYLALPLTILPQACKLRSIRCLAKCMTPSKVFCSQMGLMLCYLCNILDPHAPCAFQSPCPQEPFGGPCMLETHEPWGGPCMLETHEPVEGPALFESPWALEAHEPFDGLFDPACLAEEEPAPCQKPVFFDPTCCTPADLYRLLIQGNPNAVHCQPWHILVADPDMPNRPCASPSIY